MCARIARKVKFGHSNQFQNIYRTLIKHSYICLVWLVLALFFSGMAAALVVGSARFGYNFELFEMPIFWLVGSLIAAGLVYQCLPVLIRATTARAHHRRNALLVLIIVVGAGARIAMFWSEPVLEDDYQRYLWDGAMVANGYNPYRVSPETAAQSPAATPLGRLADDAGLVLERINHQHLRTIYPPVTQAAFALAHMIEPWSLTAWRLVCIAGEAATLLLILALLKVAGRSPLWLAIYWWNPVVIKELLNSAHMEAILLPLLLAALLLAVRRHHMSATGMLGLAVGAKLWPILLAPLILRPLLARPYRLLLAVMLLAGLLALWLLPVALAGFDPSSGFVAYAQNWKTNSALFPALELAMVWLFNLFNLPGDEAGLVVRMILFATLGGLVMRLAREPVQDPQELLMRSGLVVGALVLLSPAQFPWYAVWVAPFLCFMPVRGITVMMMTISLYYLAFYFFAQEAAIAQEATASLRASVVWLIWVPVWVLLALDARRYWRAPLTWQAQRPG